MTIVDKPGEDELVRLPRPRRLRVADLISVGFGGVTGRPGRAILSALGIAIGIAAMIAVVGIGASSQASLQATLNAFGTNLLKASPGQTLFGANATIPDNATDMVRRIGPVRSASATGSVNDTVRRTSQVDSEVTNGIALAATKDDLLATIGGTVANGTFLNAATDRYPAVVLGSVAAQRLSIDRPGKQVYIGTQYFTVVGILNPVPLAPEIDRSALVGWPAAQAYLGFDGNPTTVYERSDPSEVDAVYGVLADTVNPQDPGSIQVTRPSDVLAAQFAVNTTFTGLLLGLGAVALLVGGVGVANTMVISVLERRQEIGLRRALGASRGQIRTQFLVESTVLSGLGGLGGLVLGIAITTGYAAVRNWPTALPAGVLAGGVAASIVVGAVVGIYPASRAGRLTPVEALSTA
ncbi:MAG TPA: ABC transporter permease [Pseudonocardiaceae bacterium]|nr:ABC transporter permease [Pseudonocardiaceae bacterium]